MNPYKNLRETNFWRRTISSKMKFEIDPVISTKFKITKQNKICTAGSCFAQNLSKALKKEGYNYHVTEVADSQMTTEEIEGKSYGVFSARYGNIYTTVQLNEILKEAVGELEMSNLIWLSKDKNEYIDAIRPNIGDRFSNDSELFHSRNYHLKCVEKIIIESDIFVFTLGLTESWVSRDNGRTLPVAPGVYNLDDSTKNYDFKNLNYKETYSALDESIEILKKFNPKIKIILTVSPVPQIATYESRHVLVSNTYSKSLLRVVASEIADKYDFVDYFPSYEIITGTYTYSSYFKNDLRQVEEIGIKHVIEIFLKHYSSQNKKEDMNGRNINITETFGDDSDIVCDEEEIDKL
ncbi:MAG: GSCFA domain-containing protein [Bdellovibrionales bacterium]|jgi:hypothetical protein|nr:GSCFA domain-containing protein [Bdellovibrionales bacterium]